MRLPGAAFLLVVWLGGCDRRQPQPNPAQSSPAQPSPLARRALPGTGLALRLPQGAQVEPAAIAHADRVALPGIGAKLLIRPRLATDRPLEDLEIWARGHQVQRFRQLIEREGAGDTFALLYSVEQPGSKPLGSKRVVYWQALQLGEGRFVCFANAESEAAARAMKRACGTLTR